MTRTLTDEARRHRDPDREIDAIFVERWSPRAMSGEKIGDEELERLFEAARWAPSSFNRQPWRFLYATRGGEHWSTFLGLLTEGNRVWADEAAVLILVASVDTTEDGEPIRTHAFDAGAAWENLALQGVGMGLVVHAMEGFDHDAARDKLNLPDPWVPHAMVAVGRPGDVQDLPKSQRGREEPSDRKPVSAFVTEGPLRG